MVTIVVPNLSHSDYLNIPVTVDNKFLALSKRDINNIKVKVHDHVIKRHEDDATSVTLLVSELREELLDPVLIFKPQGSRSVEYPTIPEESFIFAFQTEFQLQLYQQHASTILCIDSTHGTNQYKFKLITIVVRDDLGKGCIYPRAWLSHRVFSHEPLIYLDKTKT